MMGTRSVVGYIGRDGVGMATYVAMDGYPTGVGGNLLENWDDVESLGRLIGGGALSTIVGSSFPDTVAMLDKYYDGRWVEGSSFSQRVYYLGGSNEYPVDLEGSEGFFGRKWPWDIEFIYVLTPDGWLGCTCNMHEEDAPHDPRPVSYMVADYRRALDLREKQAG